MKTRFETEAQGNSEVAYCGLSRVKCDLVNYRVWNESSMKFEM